MEVVYREGKDGINNLMSIYSAITKRAMRKSSGNLKAEATATSKLLSVKRSLRSCAQSVRNMTA